MEERKDVNLNMSLEHERLAEEDEIREVGGGAEKEWLFDCLKSYSDYSQAHSESSQTERRTYVLALSEDGSASCFGFAG